MPQFNNTEPLRIQGKLIKGLLPALEPKQLDQPFIVNGRNFILDFKGPKSYFYSKIITYEKIINPGHIQTFRIEDEIVIFVSGAVVKFDYDSQRYYPILTFTDSDEDWPWSMAEVGSKYYFAKKGIQNDDEEDCILEYNPNTYSWALLTSGVPTGPVAVTQSQGRLIVLGRDYYAWSSLDIGSDLTDSITTGAGRQGLSIINAKGYPIGVLEVIDGFIVYTERGCVKGEFSQGASPFRHIPISRDYSPLGPFCLVSTEDRENIILDAKGLFKSNGGRFEAYQPIFSEFLAHEYIPNNYDINNVGALIRMHYDPTIKFLILSLAQREVDPLYTKAYVLYTPRQEWGSFDRNHYGWGQVHLTDGPLKGFNFGYWCKNGYFHRILEDVFNEDDPDFRDYYFYQKHVDIPARKQDDNWIFSSLINMTSVNESTFSNTGSGLYRYSIEMHFLDPQNFLTIEDFMEARGADPTFEDYNTITDDTDDQDWNSLGSSDDYQPGESHYRFSSSISMSNGFITNQYFKYIPVDVTVDSFVEIGLFRLTQQQYPDEMSLITDVMIGCDEAPPGVEFIDWMEIITQDTIIDWMDLANSTEDYGENYKQAMEFNIDIRGSTDGKNTFEDQYEALTLAPERDEKNARYYTCYNNAIFHSFILTANEIGQSYQLKSLELSGSLTGRL